MYSVVKDQVLSCWSKTKCSKENRIYTSYGVTKHEDHRKYSHCSQQQTVKGLFTRAKFSPLPIFPLISYCIKSNENLDTNGSVNQLA